MESNEVVVNLAVQPNRSNQQNQLIMGNHPLVIVSQLLQVVDNMHHFDELLLWLAHMIVQRLGIEVIQFWAMQPQKGQQGIPELRATLSRNSVLPQHVVVCPSVVEIVEQLLGEKRGIMPQAVSTLFPPQQAALLTRYHLHYWASYFLHSCTLLPASNTAAHVEPLASPLTMVVAFFLRQPPNPRLLPTVGHVLEQVIPIAKSRGLLLSASKSSTGLQVSNKQQKEMLMLKDLIPQQAQNADAMQASNPFSSTVVIQDKQARRLYLSIDGRKNVAELAALSQLSVQDFYMSLRLLLTQRQIQFYEPGGQRIDPARILKNS